MDTDIIRRHLFKKKKAINSYFIRDLRSGMNHVNLKARILEVAEPRRVITRYGNYANVEQYVTAAEVDAKK